jgi:hypothetical protein
MDKTKWKSITLNVDDYHAIRGISYLKNRKFTGTITKLINDYIINMAKHHKTSVDKFKKQMIDKSKDGDM